MIHLGLRDFGFWALSGALAQYGALFDFGISRGVVRFVASYHAEGQKDKERAVLGVSVGAVCAVGLVMIAISLLWSNRLGSLIGIGDSRIARVLFVASAIILVTGMLGTAFVGASLGRGRAVAANLGLSLQRVGVVLGGVIALLLSPSLTSFACGSALGGLAGLIFLILAIFIDEKEIRLGRPSITVLRELLAFGIKGQILMACDLIFSNSGKIILGVALGPAAAASYELGSRLALGARSFGTSTSTVLTAHITHGYSSRGMAHIHENYRRFAQRNAAAGNFPLFALASIAVGLVPAWLGFESRDVVLVTTFLAISYTMNILSGVAMAVTVALNRIGVLVITAICSTIIAVALQFVLVHRIGLLGVLLGVGIGSLAGPLVGLIVIHRNIGVPLSDFYKPVGGPMTLGAISTTLAIYFSYLLHAPVDRLSAIPVVLLSASVFCTVYLLFGWRNGYLPTPSGLPTGRFAERFKRSNSS